MSIKRHLILNGAATALQRIVQAGWHLLVVPFFIAKWGPERYGEWLTLSAIPTAVSLCNMGLGTAAANSFVLAHGKGDFPAAARAMRAGLALLAGSVVVGSLIGGVGLGVLHFTGTFTGLSVPPDTAFGVVILLGLSTLLGFFGALIEAWFRAARRIHHCAHLNSLTILATLAATIGLLLANQGLVAVAGAQLVINVISLVGTHWAGRRLVPEVDVAAARIDRAELLEFIKKGFAFMMTPARQAINIQGTIFVTRVLLGAEAVALLGTLRTLANSIAQVYNSISQTIFPELQHAVASMREHDARRIFHFGVGATLAASLAGCAGLAVAGQFVYRKWTGGSLEASQLAWWLLIGSIFFNSLWWTAATVFRAANRPEGAAVAGIVSAGLGVLASGLLIKPLGIEGAIAGMLINELLMTLYVVPVSCQMLGQSLRGLPGDMWALRHDVRRHLPRLRGRRALVAGGTAGQRRND